MLESDSVAELLGIVETDTAAMPALPVLRSIVNFGLEPDAVAAHEARLVSRLDVSADTPQRGDYVNLLAQLDLPLARERLRQVAQDLFDPDSLTAAKLVSPELVRPHLPALLSRLTDPDDLDALNELACLPLHDYGDVPASSFDAALASSDVEHRLWAAIAVAKLGDVQPLLTGLGDLADTAPQWMWGDEWSAYDVLSRAHPVPDAVTAALVPLDDDRLERNQSLLIWALTGLKDADGNPMGEDGESGAAAGEPEVAPESLVETVLAAAEDHDFGRVPQEWLHLTSTLDPADHATVISRLIQACISDPSPYASMSWGNAAMQAIAGADDLPVDARAIVEAFLATDHPTADVRQVGAVLGTGEDDQVVRAVVQSLDQAPARADALAELLEESSWGGVVFVGAGGGGRVPRGATAAEPPPMASAEPPMAEAEPTMAEAEPTMAEAEPPMAQAESPTVHGQIVTGGGFVGGDYGGLLLGDEPDDTAGLDPDLAADDADDAEDAEDAEDANSLADGVGTTVAQPAAPRQWRADVEDVDLRTTPLQVGTKYTAQLSVDALTSGATVDFDERLFADPSVTELTLTVQVSSRGLDIVGSPVADLVVPRSGPTSTTADFVVRPRQPGACTLTMTVHLAGNFVTLFHFTVWAGTAGPATLTKVGRPPDALQNLQPRDLMLIIEHAPRSGYTCTSVGGGSYRPPAQLPITSSQLADEVDHVQQELLKVIMMNHNGVPVFQTGIQIPEAAEAAALTVLARAGARLFRSLFFHPAAGTEANKLGTLLRTIASDDKTLLTLQIIESEASIPWPLLYVGDVSDDAVLDWQHFLGMRHLIEQVPLSSEYNDSGPTIVSSPQLTVGVNVNLSIGSAVLNAKVAEHQQRWQGLPTALQGLALAPRTSRTAVLDALKDPVTADQIVYFYCHASAQGRDGDKGTAAITMEPKNPLTLEDLERNADSQVRFANRPLVFINACESSDLSPLFYTGFVPYFLSRGARGVIGTQCKTPAIFAIWFAQAFFDRFFDGSPVGDAMLATRQDFVDRYRNPLGLLYAVHCDIDTRIDPAMLATGP